MDTLKNNKWALVWSDEFDGPANSAPDKSRWKYDLGSGGWGNNELQEYTNDIDNSFLDGKGNLVIRVIKVGEVYKSARLKTENLFEIQNGKIEASIKVPYGKGIWPAFWMLGNDFSTNGWPECGEIDIMEHIGREPTLVHQVVHGPGYSGADGIHAQVALPGNIPIKESFHIFGVEWSDEKIEFFLDSKLYHQVTPASLPAGSRWVFDHPFFILLNVAVGGGWAQNPDNTSVFPQEMLVDWVRVWSIQ